MDPTGSSIINDNIIAVSLTPDPTMVPTPNKDLATPDAFWIFYCGSNGTTFNSTSYSTCFLYAPQSSVILECPFIGGLVSGTLTMNSQTKVLYPMPGGSNVCHSASTLAPTVAGTSTSTITLTPTGTPVPTATYTSCAPGYLNLTSTTKALYLGAATGNQPYVYQCNNMDLGTGSLYVDLRGGPVTLYVMGNLTCTASANPSIYMLASPMLNLTGTAQANPPNIFTVYVEGSLVMLSSEGTYNMALAAPLAAVNFYAGTGAGPGEFNGAIMAASINNTGGAISFSYPLDMVGRAGAYWQPPLLLQAWRKYLGP